MPARVSIELDPVVFKQVCEKLGLKNAPTFTLNARKEIDGARVGEKGIKKIRGLYDGANNHVTIATQGESFEKEGIYVLTKHLRFTVLHELRHAWQRENWTLAQLAAGARGAYNERTEEIDANKWAEFASPKFPGLVKVKRQQIGQSGFSRMNRRANP